MATKATTWAQAASSAKAAKEAPTDDKDTSTDEPVTITTKDITVELNDAGDGIVLTLADSVFALDLDTATDLSGSLADANPDVDTDGKGEKPDDAK